VNLAHRAGDTGVIENALGGRSLPRIDMRHYPDVTGVMDWKLPDHDFD
jgi:hypothetical protein